jgi:hypothetical protein
MKMCEDDEDKEEGMKKMKKEIKCWWFMIRYHRLAWPKGTDLKKEDQMAIIKKITKVYGRPFILLVHHIHLGLKFNRKDLCD